MVLSVRLRSRMPYCTARKYYLNVWRQARYKDYNVLHVATHGPPTTFISDGRKSGSMNSGTCSKGRAKVGLSWSRASAGVRKSSRLRKQRFAGNGSFYLWVARATPLYQDPTPHGEPQAPTSSIRRSLSLACYSIAGETGSPRHRVWPAWVTQPQVA